MQLTIAKILEALNNTEDDYPTQLIEHNCNDFAKNSNVQLAQVITHISTNSKEELTEPSAFVALKGNKFNANDFIADLFKKPKPNLKLVIGHLALLKLGAEQQKNTQIRYIRVKDTTLAFGLIARANKESLTNLASLVAITGSNGKTTIKTWLYDIWQQLAKKLQNPNLPIGSVNATLDNFNNHIGVAKTLLTFNFNTKLAIVEMGANHKGEIAYLKSLAKPNIVAINNAQQAHLGEFGSLAVVVATKGEILDNFCDKKNSYAVLNHDDSAFAIWKKRAKNCQIISFGVHKNASVRISKIKLKATSIRFTISFSDSHYKVSLPLCGAHYALNAACVFALSLTVKESLGLEFDNRLLVNALSNFSGVKGRLNFHRYEYLTIIDDTYNANPDSVKKSIEVLALQAGIKIFILGDLQEIADLENDYQNIARYALGHKINLFLTIGEDNAIATNNFYQNYQSAIVSAIQDMLGVKTLHFSDKQSFYSNIKQILKISNLERDKNQKQITNILVKGSRASKMEDVVAFLQNIAQ